MLRSYWSPAARSDITFITGECETYFILRGEGEYNDNGALRSVREGDVTYTSDGCGHALKNTGKENLVFMALIIYI